MAHFVRQFFLMVGFLLSAAFDLYAAVTSISSIKVHEKEGKTFFVVFSDQSLESQMPSMLGETVVFDLPQDVIWNAESTLEGAVGRVKDFSITSGDLEIKLLPGTALEQVIFDDRKKPYRAVFVLKEGDPQSSFQVFKKFKEVKEEPEPKPQFIIKKLKMMKVGGTASSVEITLSHPLKMVPQKVGDKIVIPVPDGTFFNIDQDTLEGHVTKVEHVKSGSGKDKILLHLEPNVALGEWRMTDETPPRLLMSLNKVQNKIQKEVSSSPQTLAAPIVPPALPISVDKQERGDMASLPQQADGSRAIASTTDLAANNMTLADLKEKASRVEANAVDPSLSAFLKKATKASHIEKDVQQSAPLTPVSTAQEQKTMDDFLKKATKASHIEQNVPEDAVKAAAAVKAQKAPQANAQAPQAANTQKVTPPPADIKQEIKFLQIKEYHGKTFLILGIEKAETFRVVENNYTHHVTVDLPKTNWDKVHVEAEKGGLIESYFVDQSHPKTTTIVISLKEGSGVYKQRVKKGDEGTAFVLIFTNNPSSSYHWGTGEVHNWGTDTHKSAEESGSVGGATPKYPEVANEEETVEKPDPFAYQTRKPVLNPRDEFQGGNTPITSIGTGLYTGGFISYAPGQAIVTGSKGANSSYDFKRSMTGFGLGGFMGYGKGFDKFYVGGEALLHMIFSESRIRSSDGPYSTKDSTYWSYGGALRLGVYGSPESLFTVKVGLMGTLFRHRPGAGADGTYDYMRPLNQNMAGLLYGFGMETAIQGQWTFRFDYSHVNYQHFTKKASIGGQDHQVRYSPQMDLLMLGFAYKFEPMFGPDSSEDVGVIPTGAYVGTGVDFSNFALRRAFVHGADTYGSKTSNMLPFWNMYLGYGVQHERLYLGIEGLVSFGTKVIQETLKKNGVSESYSSKMQSIMGLYLRPGYAFGHGNLFYGRVGVSMGRFSRSGSGNGALFTSAASARKNIRGVSLGAGLESFMTKNLSLRGEYIYELYGKVKAADSTSTETITPTNSKVQVGLSYIF